MLIASLKGVPVGLLRFGFFWDTIPFMNLLLLIPAFRRGATRNNFQEVVNLD